MFSKGNLYSSNWKNLISLYSQKELTFQKDVLPALSGITNRIRDDKDYHGGLWGKTLDYDLLWFSTVSKRGSPVKLPSSGADYIAPSFLWASVKGSIAFVHVPKEIRSFVQTFKRKSVHCTPKGHDSLGELAKGTLIITGPALWAIFKHHLQPMSANFFIKHLKSEENCNWATLELGSGEHYIWHPDSMAADFLTEKIELHIVKLFESSIPDDQTCYGLVLSKHPVASWGARVYYRVGVIASLEKSLITNNVAKEFEIS
jgi:hypothetical protein